eukprot:110165-Pelagomonas_calceolata.AAC.1
MGIWRVARHAPGRSDSPSPVLHRRAPSNPPPEAPMKTKSMSSINDREKKNYVGREDSPYIN